MTIGDPYDTKVSCMNPFIPYAERYSLSEGKESFWLSVCVLCILRYNCAHQLNSASNSSCDHNVTLVDRRNRPIDNQTDENHLHRIAWVDI